MDETMIEGLTEMTRDATEIAESVRDIYEMFSEPADNSTRIIACVIVATVMGFMIWAAMKIDAKIATDIKAKKGLR